MIQDLTTQIEESARSEVNKIHTAMPGEIVSFDPGKCIAEVKVYGKFVTNTGDSISYPDLSKVPVMFPYSPTQDVGVSFPVKPGDPCILIISEVELDEFKTGSESAGNLKFDMTSAMCIPGILKKGNECVQEADGRNAVVVKSKATKIVVDPSIVEITGNVLIHGNVTIEGNEDVTGTITSGGDQIAGGVSTMTHTHTGVNGETSGPH